MLTPLSLARATEGISGSIETRRWQLAELALTARTQAERDRALAHWAAIMAVCENVMKDERTVQDWAHTADFRAHLSREYRLTYSHHSRAAQYWRRLGLEKIEEVMDEAEAERIRVVPFAAHLADLCQPDAPDPFHLGDWLGGEYERAQQALDAAETDEDIEAVQRVLAMLDAERARVIANA